MRRLDPYTWVEVFAAIATTRMDVRGDFVGAESILRKALELNPSSWHALHALVGLYRRREGEREAAAASAAASEGSAHEVADLHAREFWEAREHYNRCRDILSERLSHGFDTEQALALGRLHMEMDEQEEADRCLRDLTADEHGADLSEPWNQLGILASRRGRHRDACRYFSEALKRDSMHLKVRTNLADALRMSGALDKAQAEYEAVLRVAVGNVEAHTGLGEIHVTLGDRNDDSDAYEQAEKSLNAAIHHGSQPNGSKSLKAANDPELAGLHYLRGYARVKQWEAAGIGSDRTLLDRALSDFECAQAGPTTAKADRAVKKINESKTPFTRNWLEERFGPMLTITLALIVFCLAQAWVSTGWPTHLAPGLYVTLTFSALLFVIAGIFLPRLLKLKVGGIELEKTSVSQVGTATQLGIARASTGSPRPA
jgi:tetratricopeptide (TPR) repeat protein